MKIIITESQLKRIVKEQDFKIPTPYVFPAESTSVNIPNQDLVAKSLEIANDVKYAISTYQCLPKPYRYPTHVVLNNLDESGKLSPRIVSLALGIIGRESSFTSGKRWYVMNVIKTAMDTVGLGPSMGPAQMTAETAKMVGMTIDEIKKEQGALRAAALLLEKLYTKAKSIGYTSEPSNVKGGSGDAAMDYSIMAYNVGITAIKPYCESVDPARKKKNLKTACEKIKDTKQRVVVKNYVPNFNTTRKDFVDTWSHGYIREVAKTAKEKFLCFPKVGSFPKVTSTKA